jgi:hypothetical protein
LPRGGEQEKDRLGALQLPVVNLLPILAGSDACGGIKVEEGSLEALFDPPLPQGAGLLPIVTRMGEKNSGHDSAAGAG